MQSREGKEIIMHRSETRIWGVKSALEIVRSSEEGK